MSSRHEIIGSRQRRVDAWGKVTGRAKFAEDISAPHQLFGRALHSKHAHARIVRIDTTRAEALPGVLAVLTAKDVPGSNVFGVVTQNQRILADDRVRYLGDGVALIAAASRAIAEEAAALIEVEYEPLPVVSDAEEAMSADAPRIHGESNVFVHHDVKSGDLAQGFARR